MNQELYKGVEGEDLINLMRAEAFCIAAHSSINQTRRYSAEPYYNHPLRVALIVKKAEFWSPAMLMAAMLHDVVEDTGVSSHLIYQEFGGIVGDYVTDLTDVSELKDGNRAKRKANDCRRLAEISPSAKTVKLADIIDNMTGILDCPDPEFIKTFCREKKMALSVLLQGDERLFALARDLVNKTLLQTA